MAIIRRVIKKTIFTTVAIRCDNPAAGDLYLDDLLDAVKNKKDIDARGIQNWPSKQLDYKRLCGALANIGTNNFVISDPIEAGDFEDNHEYFKFMSFLASANGENKDVYKDIFLSGCPDPEDCEDEDEDEEETDDEEEKKPLARFTDRLVAKPLVSSGANSAFRLQEETPKEEITVKDCNGVIHLKPFPFSTPPVPSVDPRPRYTLGDILNKPTSLVEAKGNTEKPAVMQMPPIHSSDAQLSVTMYKLFHPEVGAVDKLCGKSNDLEIQIFKKGRRAPEVLHYKGLSMSDILMACDDVMNNYFNKDVTRFTYDCQATFVDPDFPKDAEKNHHQAFCIKYVEKDGDKD